MRPLGCTTQLCVLIGCGFWSWFLPVASLRIRTIFYKLLLEIMLVSKVVDVDSHSFGSCMVPSVTQKLVVREEEFRSAPVQGFLDSVSEMHGAFSNRDLPLGGTKHKSLKSLLNSPGQHLHEGLTCLLRRTLLDGLWLMEGTPQPRESFIKAMYVYLRSCVY